MPRKGGAISKKMLIIIAVAVVSLITIIGVVVYFIFVKPGTETTETPEQIAKKLIIARIMDRDKEQLSHSNPQIYENGLEILIYLLEQEDTESKIQFQTESDDIKKLIQHIIDNTYKKTDKQVEKFYSGGGQRRYEYHAQHKMWNGVDKLDVEAVIETLWQDMERLTAKSPLEFVHYYILARDNQLSKQSVPVSSGSIAVSDYEYEQALAEIKNLGCGGWPKGVPYAWLLDITPETDTDKSDLKGERCKKGIGSRIIKLYYNYLNWQQSPPELIVVKKGGG